MISKVYSAVVVGLDAELVEVEVDIRRGLNKFFIVGLPDKAISEAKERIESTIKSSSFEFPRGRVVVNLAPANIPKSGSLYDLPIAIGILKASGQINLNTDKYIFVGELSLDGSIRKAKGVLPIVAGLYKYKKNFFVPTENRIEVSLVKNANSFVVDDFDELVNNLNNLEMLDKVDYRAVSENKTKSSYDLKNVIGQYHAKRALEIAAAGGHNLLFKGVPGSGKTYISRCITGILPSLTEEERLEVTKIYSASDRFSIELLDRRPFRSPHTTSSDVSLIGGGRIPRPGEVTLAHRGVLFLDEFPEFSNKTLEALRQPLEDRIVTVSRATGSMTFPADFILLAAMNPCKCGFLGDPTNECICTQNEILKYQKKISGPIMDRIDLQVSVPKVKVNKLLKNNKGEESTVVRIRVEEARKIQMERYGGNKALNSSITSDAIRRYISLSKDSLALLKSAVDSLNLTARSYFKVLKVARTIADLEKSESVTKDHVTEALSFRL